MTDKEKIRAEVEKLYEAFTKDYSLEGVASAAQLHKILVFIDSLSEPASESLKEAARKYAETKHSDNGIIDIVSRGFSAGAKWQKEQMIEEVVEGTYDCNDIDSWICFDGLVESTSKVGEKVKVIIIKEAEK